MKQASQSPYEVLNEASQPDVLDHPANSPAIVRLNHRLQTV